MDNHDSTLDLMKWTLAKITAALTFIAAIFAANFLTSRYGMVPVGFGLTATAGTYLAGVSFVARDTVQDTAGRRATIALILVGAALSALASPSLALASGCAFVLSETIDMAIYTPLRERGYVRAAVASNVAGAIIDTFVFLTIAGFPVMASFAGQIVGKVAVTVVVIALVTLYRAVRTTQGPGPLAGDSEVDPDAVLSHTRERSA